MESLATKASRKVPAFLHHVISLTLLAAVASSLPVQSKHDTSPAAWMLTGKQRGKSHVMMWMFTAKKLLPRVQELSDMTLGLMDCVCQEQHMSLHECLDYAGKLTPAEELAAFPSPSALKQEKKKKTFGKVLMKDAHEALTTTESSLSLVVKGLEADGSMCTVSCESTQGACANRFLESLNTASQQFEALVESFYGAKVSDKPRSKKNTANMKKDEALKTLYLAYNRFQQISSVLEYSVELSWFTQMHRKK